MEHKMMTCEEVREEIDRLSAGRRSVPSEERMVHIHLMECETCRKLYEEARAQNRLLDAWVAPAPRGNIQARVMAGIARMERELREKQKRQDFWDQAAALFGHRFRVPAAVALVLAAMLLGSIGLNVALLSSNRSKLQRLVANPPPLPAVQLIDRDATNRGMPTLMPAASGERAVQTFVQQGLPGLGAYSQRPGTMPLAIIVILGAPPMVGDAHATLTNM